MLCSVASANSLNPATDSLKKLVSPAVKNSLKIADTITIRRITDLAHEYFESNPDSTKYYGELGVKLATKIKDPKGIADGSVQVASVEAFVGNYINAKKLYQHALKIYNKIGFAHGVFNCYTGMGSVEDYLGNYDEAIGFYNKALKIALQSRNQTDAAECYNYIGITYDNRGDYSKALDNYFKALIINIKIKDELGAADQYCNIGIIMHELELYSKALNYYKKSLDIWTRMEDTQGVGVIHENIGEVLLDQGKYKEALPHLNYARLNFNEMNDPDGISLIAYDFGLYKLRTGDIDSAITYFNRSLQSAARSKIEYNKAKAYWGLAQAFNKKKDFRAAYNYALQAENTARSIGSLNIKSSAMQQTSIALAGLKRFEEAYNKMLAYSELRGRLKHSESVQKIAFYNLEIEFAKQQKEIAAREYKKEVAYNKKLARQRQINVVGAATTIVVAVMAGIYYRGRRKQKAINVVLQQKNDEILLQQADINRQSEKLNELNLLKDRLIGVLAHDLRAPISTLRGLFNLLIDKSISNEEFITMTPTVFGKLEQTSDFLDTLLSWINSQVDSRQGAVKVFKLAELVEKELLHLSDKIQQKDVKVVVKVEAEVQAFAEPNSIRIVIHNFLTNAIKFSNRGGTIEISAGTKGARTYFCIKDNGVGISEQHLVSLFKSRVNSLPGTENETGTGMGLLFCKDLIEKYNGNIWAESKLDQGTSLCFELPG
ncbi:tetratricopeptide repeat-containing sensor histidine kinase [Mucilaginibacter auburnensis]|nr:tetratricopeptide repeat protein [Mucilaginibacter auburnensis]